MSLRLLCQGLCQVRNERKFGGIAETDTHHSTGQHRFPQSNTTSTDTSPIPTPENSRPSTPASHILGAKSGPKGGASRRARKALNPASHASSGEERSEKPKKDTKKKMRKWDNDGMADEEDGVVLDYSASANDKTEIPSDNNTASEQIDAQSFGTRTGKGQYVLKDLDDEVHSILKSANEKKPLPAASKSGVVGSSLGAISGLFRNFVGGKVLSKEDLEKPMKGMEEHLLKKNVAREAAVRLCEGVERELIGVKTGSYESTSLFSSSQAQPD